MDLALFQPYMDILLRFIESPILHISLVMLVSLILFVKDVFSVDAVAFGVLLSLLWLGLVPESEILSGFSNSATITVVAMFIISAGLQRTGIIQWLANRLQLLVGKTQTRLSAILMSFSGFLSAFMSNTATVAVFLPISIRLCQERNVHPGKVLMPLSFAAQFGGVCTLVGTTTNLLVNGIAKNAGVEEFTIFEFSKLGLICFVVGLVYMLIAGKFLLKERHGGEDSTDKYKLQDYLTEMRVTADSVLVGQKGGSNELTKMEDIHILEIIRGGDMIWAPSSTEIHADDVLLIRGSVDKVMDIAARLKLEDWADGNLSDAHLKSDDISLMEVMVANNSRLIGRTLTQLDFYWRYHAAVVGVRRRDTVLRERVSKVSFKAGDSLLLQGHRHDLEILKEEKDFITLQDLSELRLKRRRAVISVLILLLVLISTSVGFSSLLAASLTGAAAMVFTRCLTLREAYEAIDMKIVMLLAGLIPLGMALDTSGASVLIATAVHDNLGAFGPMGALAGVYLITMVLTALISNAATAVLLAPLSISIAHGMDVSAQPFLMAVAFAASTCFTTPVGYQTNAMVYGPGGYKYIDFLKVGLPLNVIFFVISIALIPIIWPF